MRDERKEVKMGGEEGEGKGEKEGKEDERG